MIAVNSGLGFLIVDARNAGNRYDLVVAGMVIIGSDRLAAGYGNAITRKGEIVPLELLGGLAVSVKEAVAAPQASKQSCRSSTSTWRSRAMARTCLCSKISIWK